MKTLMYTFAVFATMATLTPPGAHADTDSDRAGLLGSWVQNGGTNKWVIENADKGLHVMQLEGATPLADFNCAPDGHDCAVKIAGHKATISMYYNGSALIQMETKGDQVVKRRFALLPSGSSMKVTIMPMTGKAATEELEFERSQPAARK